LRTIGPFCRAGPLRRLLISRRFPRAMLTPIIPEKNFGRNTGDGLDLSLCGRQHDDGSVKAWRRDRGNARSFKRRSFVPATNGSGAKRSAFELPPRSPRCPGGVPRLGSGEVRIGPGRNRWHGESRNGFRPSSCRVRSTASTFVWRDSPAPCARRLSPVVACRGLPPLP
jgi:hypothetical protein